MSIEFRDGSWSDIEPLEKAYSDFQELMKTESENVKAFHIGNVDYLTELRKKNTWEPETVEEQKKDLQTQIDELKAMVKELTPVKSSFIHIPTVEERKIYGEIKKMENKNKLVIPV